ncbi:calpain-13-like [Spea bombifrons]|uniref:calpain-13-like n=1 Tax=Spea bombifrons TaxID=233779 RepID=UPI00234AB98A|nr:calpain-13-like [Spea bombifrons]
MDPLRINTQPRPQDNFTLGSASNPRKFKNQDFEALREYHLRKGLLFEDELFPANMKSIGPKLEQQFQARTLEWRRPKLADRPQFIVDGSSLFDILQSELGDCWVLSVLGALTLKPYLLKKIIPSNQEYDKNYTGIFHFRFWSFGEWLDVVVDDKLPFVDGRYLSVKPSCENELWPCLVEKAYAKLLGSYEKLHFGNPAEAFVNFTGGLVLTFDLKSDIHQPEIFHMVNNAGPETLMTCTTKKKDGSERNRSLSLPALYVHNDIRRGSVPISNIPESVHLGDGLVESHAYSIVGTERVNFRNEVVNLVRIWNPWGYGEWIGPWCDSSPLWKEVSAGEKLRLHRLKEDGEFWMSWEDFVDKFSKVIICSRAPDFLDWDHQPKQWYKQKFWGMWPKGIGVGDYTNEDLLYTNPQYLLKVNGSDVLRKGYNVAISIMQHPNNWQRFSGEWPSIDFQVIEVDSKFYGSREKLPSSAFSKKILSGLNRNTQSRRDLTTKLSLNAGTYVIIPSIARTPLEASFLLQIFLKSRDSVVELGLSSGSDIHNPGPLPANYLRYEDRSYETTFRRYASQGNKMNVNDLHRFLNEVVLKGFSSPAGGFTKDSGRTMLTSMDQSGSGYLTAESFGQLWRYLTRFKDIFAEIDVNRCGFLDSYELQKAVEFAGLFVTKSRLNQLICLYGNNEQKVQFVDFLLCMIRLKAISNTMRNLSTDAKGIYLSQEKLIQLMI